MRVILQEKSNLGKVGDQVMVRPGFARNFLLPTQKAVLATPKNLATFEIRRAELEKVAEEKFQAAEARAAKLAELNVEISANASEEGKLFGSIGPRDVADAVTAAGVAVEKSEVSMPQGPIRNIGEYTVAVHVHSDLTAEVKLNVVIAK
jgi:large subunit ribosomal protein L9